MFLIRQHKVGNKWNTNLTRNDFSNVVIGAAIEVHRVLGGPGLLEDVYEEALCYELSLFVSSSAATKVNQQQAAQAEQQHRTGFGDGLAGTIRSATGGGKVRQEVVGEVRDVDHGVPVEVTHVPSGTGAREAREKILEIRNVHRS